MQDYLPVANGGELFGEIWSGYIMVNSVINENSTYKNVGKAPLYARSKLSGLNRPAKRRPHVGNTNQQAF